MVLEGFLSICEDLQSFLVFNFSFNSEVEILKSKITTTRSVMITIFQGQIVQIPFNLL